MQTRLRLHPLLAIGFALLTMGCSANPDAGLAVSKLTPEQVQDAAFLQLNADKPGSPVAWQRYLAQGKYTVVAFISPFEPACANLEQGLSEFVLTRNDIAVRTVNINRPGVTTVDWRSPIAQDLQIQTLPYFIIYDPGMNVRAKGRPAYEQVNQWLANKNQ